MARKRDLLILAFHISLVMSKPCLDGQKSKNGSCTDVDECDYKEKICGMNAVCFNTYGSYYCQCRDGYTTSGNVNFTADTAQCKDIDIDIGKCHCGQNASCIKTLGSYHCVCNLGFRLRSGKSNFKGNTVECEELNFDAFWNRDILEQTLPGAQDLVNLLKTTFLKLTEKESPTDMHEETLLERLLSIIDGLLFKLSQSSGGLIHNSKISALLDTVEDALRFIGPLIKTPQTKKSHTFTELELLVQRGAVLPQGPVTLSSEHSRLGIQWEMAAGEVSSYPGFTTVSLLSYGNLEDFTNGYFSGIRTEDKRFQINSKVVTATVSNTDTDVLAEPVKLTFYHLKQTNESNHTCVYWDSKLDGGTWSGRGCSVVESNSEYTVCSCNHLSSFAVLMALYEIEDQFELQLITWVGLSVSLLCLFMCILTFSLIRSIKSPRTTIHLHLCISLFIANIVFLAGISRTENRVVCAVTAGMLHFFYLAAFCWMCLEGIQLYRMVILVFNTTFKTLYLMAGGYGIPALIVVISAISNAQGYGTKKYCWLNLEGGFIWSFFGPACIIIMLNIFFFLITVWKLAQKFSSLNPDLNNLHKIKAFTITAVAQLCVLGTMWIFGCFQFDKGTIAVSYLFTILNSLQGAMLFIMHCLLSKQIREEYGQLLSRMCVPQKKKYSEFPSSLSNRTQTTKSSQNTGESHI